MVAGVGHINATSVSIKVSLPIMGVAKFVWAFIFSFKINLPKNENMNNRRYARSCDKNQATNGTPVAPWINDFYMWDNPLREQGQKNGRTGTLVVEMPCSFFRPRCYCRTDQGARRRRWNAILRVVARQGLLTSGCLAFSGKW